jgi:hypothetical protein
VAGRYRPARRQALPSQDVSDPTEADQPPISDEQARQYVAQLRSAPAEQIVIELLSGLLNAAQIKLGRRDARLLIDLGSMLLDHSRRYLRQELTRQIEQALHQLRLGQVQAESTVDAKAEPNDLPDTPTPPDAEATPAAPPPQPSPVSRLWVPGRGP